MPARLVSLNDHPDLPLVGILTLVGRDHDCDARIDSSRISRHHCCLSLQADRLAVRDLTSTNGTWVNNQRVDAASLRDGDEIRIAHLRYRLKLAPAAESPYQCPHDDAARPLDGNGSKAGDELLSTER